MAEQLDQQQTVAAYWQAAIYGAFWYAQTFQAGLTGSLSTVKLWMSRSAGVTFSNLVVEIQGEDGSGKPDGNVLSSSEEITPATVPIGTGNASEITVNFSTPAPSVSGTKYSIVLRQKDAGGDATSYYVVFRGYEIEGGEYPNGTWCFSNTGGSYWSIVPNKDLYFKTYVLVTATETGSYGLTSNLKKLISSSYTLISNLSKSISSNYSLISFLRKVLSGTFSLIARLTDVERSSLRDYFTWDIMGSIAAGIQIGGTKVFAGPTVLKKIIIYCKNTGSSSSTIIDVNKNGVSVFDNPADRPTLEYDDADKLDISEVDNVKFTIRDTISIDIDQRAPGTKDLTVVAVIEPFTGYPPVIEEITLLDENFPMGIKIGWPSNKTKIKVRFDRSMDSAVTPVFYITDQESQSTPTIIAGSWISTKCSNDTYVTGEMDLSGNSYIGKLLLNIKSAKDLYGSVMASYATNIEIEDWEPIRCEKEYTNTASNEFIIDCRTAKEMRFSLDGSTWGSWVSYENTYTVDITDITLGGSAVEEMKKVYVQFRDGGIVSSGEYYYDIGYYYSAIDFTCLMMNTNIYGSEMLNKMNQIYLNWYYGDSAKTVPISHTNIYIDDVLENKIDHTSYIHSGFDIDLSGANIEVESGEYYDDNGVYHSVSNQVYDVDDFAPLPVLEDRIDLLYVDFSDSLIKINPGVEGQTEEKITYKRFIPQYTLDTSYKYPILPQLVDNAVNLYYIYIRNYIDPAQPGRRYIRFRLKWFGQTFKQGLNYISKKLDDGVHTIKIEVVDQAGRTAFYEYIVNVTASKKLNVIKAYPTAADRTAGTNEVTGGEIHNYTKLYYKIEGE